MVTVLVGPLALVGSSAGAITIGDQFELDGNPQDDVNIDGDDWDTPPAPDGSATAFTFIPDGRDDGDDSYFTGGGSKDVRDVSEWLWTTSDQAPDKDEILNAFAAAYIVNEELYIFFGADRYANNGDAQVGFWFFHDEISLLGDAATDGGGSFDGVHDEGDILVLSNFTNGGSQPNIEVLEWDPTQPKNLHPTDLEGAVVDCSDPDHHDDVCAIVNSGPVPVPNGWNYAPKQGPAQEYPAGSFYEGGLNVSALLDPADICISTFMAETRSSAKEDAQLKDFALGEFDVCGDLSIEKYIDVNYDGDFDSGTDLAGEGWDFEVYGPDPTPELPDDGQDGPLVCSGDTNASGELECDGANETLAGLTTGTYTIVETQASGYYNTDPGDGATPPNPVETSTVTKRVVVGLGGDVTVQFGNICYSDFTFTVTGVPTGPNAPTSITAEYRIDDGSWQTTGLVQQASPNESTWSKTLTDLLLQGETIDWRFYVNGDTTAKKDAGEDIAAGGYPGCAVSDDGTFDTVTLGGFKYKDANANGDHDTGELGLAGVSFQLWHASDWTAFEGGDTSKSAITSTTSDAGGAYSFTGVEFGDYVIVEVDNDSGTAGTQHATGWKQTEPANNGNRTISVGLLDTGSLEIGDFGNTPLSQIDVDFTSLGALPDTSDATEATSIKCYTDYGETSQTEVGSTTTSNSLSVTDLETSQSEVTCVIEFQDP